MRTRALPLALLTAGAVGLAGCGTTTVRHVTTTITRTAPGATTSGPGATTPGSGATTRTGSAHRPGSTHRPGSGSRSTAGPPASRSGGSSSSSTSPRPSAAAGRSPRSLIDAAAAALRHAGGYAMSADLVQDHARTRIALTTTGRRTFDATLTVGGASFDVISLPGRAYLRGDSAFWRSHTGSGPAARARARRLAGHWLEVPPSGRHSVTRSLGTLSPATLARCLTEDHGTLTIAGHARIRGTRAVVVRDAGDAPGSTPSTIAVAAAGAPYPLRYVATGRTRSGGRVDTCNDGKGDGATGTIALSHFGNVPQIHPPSGAQSGQGAPIA